MKSINRVILVPIFLLLFSCIQKISDTGSVITCIDVAKNIDNFQELKLSQYTNDIQYIPLKIKDDIVFSGLWDCVFSEKYFLAKNWNACLLYDYEGNVISKIGNNGRGPGEFNSCRNAFFASENKVFIQSLYDLLEYDIDGSFRKKYENAFLINQDFVGSWSIINDSLIFGKISSSIGNEKFKSVIYKYNGEVIYKYPNHIYFKRDKALASHYEYYADIYSVKKEIFFKEIFNDTLFYLSEKFELKPRYYISLGKYSMPLTERMEFYTQIRKSYVSSHIIINNVFQTPDFLLLSCDFGEKIPAKRLTPRVLFGSIESYYNTRNVLGIYNIKTGDFVFCKPASTDDPLNTSGLYNDIDGGPRLFPKAMVNDSTMAMWVDAKQLKDHVASDDFKNCAVKYPEKKKALQQLADSLTEFDNPVLLIVKFKK